MEKRRGVRVLAALLALAVYTSTLISTILLRHITTSSQVRRVLHIVKSHQHAVHDDDEENSLGDVDHFVVGVGRVLRPFAVEVEQS